ACDGAGACDGLIEESRAGGVRRLFCSTRSRSAKLGARAPAERAGADEPPAMTRTGATGVAGCSRARSARASGRPPFSRIAATCLSRGAGGRGGGGRATRGRLGGAGGGGAPGRPASAPSTLGGGGRRGGGGAVTAAPASAAAGRRTTCPP